VPGMPVPDTSNTIRMSQITQNEAKQPSMTPTRIMKKPKDGARDDMIKEGPFLYCKAQIITRLTL
jgi:hypothetical protein